MDVIKILNILFDEGDHIGLKRDKKDGSASPQSMKSVVAQFQTGGHFEAVHIHPYQVINDYFEVPTPDGDFDVVSIHIRTCKAETITKYRSFVIELDPKNELWETFSIEMKDRIIDEQVTFFKKIGLPVSCIVSSGNKSAHHLITLKNPLPSLEDWKYLRCRLEQAISLKLGTVVWRNLSGTCVLDIPTYTVGFRLCDVIRSDTGKFQKLISIKGRVENDELESWLCSNGASKLIGSASWNKSKRLKYTFTFEDRQKTAYLMPNILKIIQGGYSGSNPSAVASRVSGSLAFQDFSEAEIIEIIGSSFEEIDPGEIGEIVGRAVDWAANAKPKRDG
jgi:hypothetical protein